jgi:serine/threonine-protein phosphatase 6 regulatory subunit 3
MCFSFSFCPSYVCLNDDDQAGDIQTTVGSVTPLTFERFRICELFAELLHCSNMALLNRPSIHDQLYDSKGRLQGGLSALEDLAQVIQLNGSPEFDEGGVETTEDEDEVDDGDSGMMMAMSDIDSLPIAGMGGGGGSGGGSTATAERYRSQGVGSDDREGETGSIGSSDMTGSPGSSEDDEDDGDDKDEDDDDIGKMVEIAVGDDDEQQPKAGGGGKGLRIDTTPATISKRQHQQQQSQLLVESPSSIPDEVKSEAEGTAATSPQREEEIPRPANPDVDVQMAALSSSAAEYDENVLTPQISRASRRSTSRRSSRRTTLPEPLPDLSQTPGSQLKQRLLDLEILSTLLVCHFCSVILPTVTIGSKMGRL